MPCLLYPTIIFDKNCWVGFQSKSSFCGKNFSSIQSVLKIWHAFWCKGGLVLDCIWNVIYGAFFTIVRPFLDTRIFFHNFFWYYTKNDIQCWITFSVITTLLCTTLNLNFGRISVIIQCTTSTFSSHMPPPI